MADAAGVQSVYDFWLGLLPQFFSQIGAAAAPTPPLFALPFPADQIAKAAKMTQDALQGIARTYAPMLEASGGQGLLAQWAATMPYLASMQQALGAVGKPPTDPVAMSAWMSALPFALPSSVAANRDATGAVALPFQQMQRAWLDAGANLMGGGAQGAMTAFDRTFGAVSDALGFGPMRKLQAAGRELVEAGIAQNEARLRYAALVQGAFASGLELLLARLAAMAKSGDRVDSVLALLRMWAVCTEEAVHRVLQSTEGLEATAAIARAGFAYRRKLQHVASIVADALDMTTRRDLDEAYREIQQLKREVRALRPPLAVPKRANATGARATKRKPS